MKTYSRRRGTRADIYDTASDRVELMVELMKSRHMVRCQVRYPHIGEELGCRRCILEAYFNRMVSRIARERIEDSAAAVIDGEIAQRHADQGRVC